MKRWLTNAWGTWKDAFRKLTLWLVGEGPPPERNPGLIMSGTVVVFVAVLVAAAAAVTPGATPHRHVRLTNTTLNPNLFVASTVPKTTTTRPGYALFTTTTVPGKPGAATTVPSTTTPTASSTSSSSSSTTSTTAKSG